MLKPNYDEITRILESDNIEIPSLLSKREYAELYLALQSWMVVTRNAFMSDLQERELLYAQIDMLKEQCKAEMINIFMSEMDK